MADGIRDAATVVLVREGAFGRELFWVRRSREVSLGGGFYAFPGGRIDPADADLARALGTDALRIGGLRELFEEAGVLLCDGPLDRSALARGRTALLAGERSFASVVRALGVTLAPGRLVDAGRWLTPPFSPVRYDARFFVAPMPEGQEAEVWPGELASGDWVTADEALGRWRTGRALLHPPALHVFDCLRDAPPAQALERLRSPPFVTDFVAGRIEFQRGFLLVPVRSPTLPPATHTNTLLVGEEELVVIDPASPDPDEQARLGALCRALVAEGRRFREILLTHEHQDHVGGVEALRAQLGVPVRAHRLTAERLAGRVRVDAFIEHGERLALPGPQGLTLRALHTPGHARGHLCFLEERSGSLVTGDMVAGLGSIVVDPPEGDMGDYVASLRLLRALPVRALYPSHGPVIPDGPRKLDEYLAHRQDREDQVFRALAASGGGTPVELVAHVYTDVPEPLHPLAARSLLAVLEKLANEGRARRDGDSYHPV